MSKQTVSTIAKGVLDTAKKHRSEILIGLGIGGMFTSGIMAIAATPMALSLLQKKKEELETDKLSVKEVVKTTWKCYISSAVVSLASAGCIIGAGTINSKHTAVLATAYTLSETKLKEYQDKVIEIVGEEKEKDIRQAVNQERVEKTPVQEIIITDGGNDLCYDVFTGRYFKTDAHKIRKAEEELNRRLRSEMYISLNEFYYELGLESVKLGDELGWSIDDGYIEVEFDSRLTKDAKPCIVLDYNVAPRYEYR